MERYPMHLLDGFVGEGDVPLHVEQQPGLVKQEPHRDMEMADRELDLRLGLSVGGVAGSSSARSIPAATEEVAPAPSAIIEGAISPPIRARVVDENIPAAPVPAEQSLPSFFPPMMMLDPGAYQGLLAEGSGSAVISPSSFSAIEANEDMIMEEMPFVCTTGISNNRTIKGILYNYRTRDEVIIVCVCHGSFMTPMEFVRHTGGGDIIDPMRHIFMCPSSFVLQLN